MAFCGDACRAHKVSLCLLILACSSFLSPEASAQDKDRQQLEDALFGAEQESDSTDSSRQSLEDDLFGSHEEDEDTADTSSPLVSSEPGATQRIQEALLEADDELAIGGFLFMQLNQSRSSGDAFKDTSISAPNLFDLYLDARPSNRVRAFVSGRLLYDYTIDDTDGGTLLGQGSSASFLAPGVSTSEPLQAQLAQLWLKFDLWRKVYVTLGRQRVRWGSGRFWNPTDFLNQSQINPIALFDQRLGVDMIKAHLPVEALGWNFYAVATLGSASSFQEIGGALRGEFILFNGELATSVSARRQVVSGPTALEPFYTPSGSWPSEGTPLRLGLDYSRGVGPFELRVEAAFVRGEQKPFYRGSLNLDLAELEFPEDYTRKDEWLAQVVVSSDLTLTYAEDETLILAAEYFYNQQGYSSSDLYLWLALQQGLTPLYLGRHYGAVAAVIPSPGSWNNTSFTASVLGNLSDGSFLSRLDWSYALFSDLRINAYVMKFFGNTGEFNFRVSIPAIPGQTDAPVEFAAPSLSTGVGLRASF